jgi:hypothetical protein
VPGVAIPRGVEPRSCLSGPCCFVDLFAAASPWFSVPVARGFVFSAGRVRCLHPGGSRPALLVCAVPVLGLSFDRFLDFLRHVFRLGVANRCVVVFAARHQYSEPLQVRVIPLEQGRCAHKRADGETQRRKLTGFVRISRTVVTVKDQTAGGFKMNRHRQRKQTHNGSQSRPFG